MISPEILAADLEIAEKRERGFSEPANLKMVCEYLDYFNPEKIKAYIEEIRRLRECAEYLELQLESLRSLLIEDHGYDREDL